MSNDQPTPSDRKSHKVSADFGLEEMARSGRYKVTDLTLLVTSVLFAFINAIVLNFYFGWVSAIVWLVATLTATLAMGYFAKQITLEGLRHSRSVIVSAVLLVALWCVAAVALWMTQQKGASIVAVSIAISLCFQALFTSSHNKNIGWITIGMPATVFLGFMLFGVWAEFPTWIAIATSISSIGTILSIGQAAKLSRTNSTELQLAIGESRATRERLEFAIESAGEGYFELDIKTMAYRPNPRMVANFGYEQKAQTATDLREMVHQDDQELAFGNLARVANDELLGWNQDLQIRMADGEFRWMHLRARLLETRGEQTLLCTLTDLRERKVMEESLRSAKEAAEASSRAKSEFLANMSHEIRTPLNGVLGMAQALESDGLTPEQADKVGVILDSGKALTALLNDVLDLSKIEAGKLEISAVPGDFLHTMKRTRQLFQTQAEEKGLELSARFDSDFPQRLGYDPVRVRQCLSNLLSNAIKFTAEGRVEVAISAKPDGDNSHIVRVEVSDTGIGMNQDVQDRLFSAFTQADGATTREYGGSGLGLSISRQLARMMGGDITVSSEVGHGSTFTLTFRADKVAPQVQTISAPAPSLNVSTSKGFSLRGKRVLLTDDNAVNRQVIRLFLAPQGCEIVEATNGKEALDKVATEVFDVVLLDVHMPIMDGKETIRRMRASKADWGKLPVIALTADAMQGDREKFIEMGMTDYLAKPVDQRELLVKLNEVLGTAKAAQPVAQTGT